MARGFLFDPGKASLLKIACPAEEAVMALCGVVRRLGIQARYRTLRSSECVTFKNPDAIEHIFGLMGATRSARGWTSKRSDGEARDKANRLANLDDANMRRSAKAAAEASEKTQYASEVLDDSIPDSLRRASQLRIDHVDKSLEEFDKIAEPQIIENVIADRIRRLFQLAEKVGKAHAAEGK